MKAVLMSIKPKWCELIANGSKTVEVRKTRPKFETPFKVYIYMTKESKRKFLDHRFNSCSVGKSHHNDMGKVIGEFVCDRLLVADCDSVAPFDKHTKRYIGKESCLSKEEFVKYTRMRLAFGWNISNLVIYDEPKELSEFYKECKELKCYGCHHLYYENTPNCYEEWCACDGAIPITRPPQSWCYVEELR